MTLNKKIIDSGIKLAYIAHKIGINPQWLHEVLSTSNRTQNQKGVLESVLKVISKIKKDITKIEHEIKKQINKS